MECLRLLLFLIWSPIFLTSSRFGPRHTQKKKELRNNRSDVNVYAYDIIRPTNEQIFGSHLYSHLYIFKFIRAQKHERFDCYIRPISHPTLAVSRCYINASRAVGINIVLLVG